MRLRPRMTLFLRKERPMERSTYVEMPDGVYEVMVSELRGLGEALVFRGRESGLLRGLSSEQGQWQGVGPKVLRPRREGEVSRGRQERMDVLDRERGEARWTSVWSSRPQLVLWGSTKELWMASYVPSQGWSFLATWTLALANIASCFDVSTAFLSGKEVKREVYIRAPADGLPACPQLGKKAVAQENFYVFANQPMDSVKPLDYGTFAQRSFLWRLVSRRFRCARRHTSGKRVILWMWRRFFVYTWMMGYPGLPEEVHQWEVFDQGVARPWRKACHFPRGEDEVRWRCVLWRHVWLRGNTPLPRRMRFYKEHHYQLIGGW